jgi:hypothetical protein
MFSSLRPALTLANILASQRAIIFARPPVIRMQNQLVVILSLAFVLHDIEQSGILK